MPDVAAERPHSDAEQRTDGGALMARTLRAHGVTTVFTLPGGHILPFLDASIGEDLRIIDTRHEGAAVLAAEGWALATGQTGVAAVTAGPGFANGLIGLLDAATWSVPVVLLPGGGTPRPPPARGGGRAGDLSAAPAPLPASVRRLRRSRRRSARSSSPEAERSGRRPEPRSRASPSSLRS